MNKTTMSVSELRINYSLLITNYSLMSGVNMSNMTFYPSVPHPHSEFRTASGASVMRNLKTKREAQPNSESLKAHEFANAHALIKIPASAGIQSDSEFRINYSLLITPYSLLLTHYSLLLTHYSLLITPYSLLLTHYYQEVNHE
jgi:hypothetical protein